MESKGIDTMVRLFISHSSEDDEFVREPCYNLGRQGDRGSGGMRGRYRSAGGSVAQRSGVPVSGQTPMRARRRLPNTENVEVLLLTPPLRVLVVCARPEDEA